MRICVCSIFVLISAVAIVACGGNGDPTPTPPAAATVAVPTATPFAVLPVPTVVTGPGGSASTGAVDDVNYTVEAGDAISTIAERFGVPADVIREANGIVGNDIFVGQVLRIPRTTGGSGATPTPAPGAPGTYVVQPGDTAFGVALQFDVTLEALEQANGVGPGGLDALSLGQVLRIPAAQ